MTDTVGSEPWTALLLDISDDRKTSDTDEREATKRQKQRQDEVHGREIAPFEVFVQLLGWTNGSNTDKCRTCLP